MEVFGCPDWPIYYVGGLPAGEGKCQARLKQGLKDPGLFFFFFPSFCSFPSFFSGWADETGVRGCEFV